MPLKYRTSSLLSTLDRILPQFIIFPLFLSLLESDVSRGFVCQTGEVLNKIRATDVPRCLECPSGFFAKKGAESCTLCPAGTYQNEPRQGTCKACPPGTWTETKGSQSEADCVPVCGHGTYGPSGLVCFF